MFETFSLARVSVTLEKKFIAVGCDFGKIQLYVPLVGLTKCNFVCTGKSPEAAQSVFPVF